MQQQVPQVDEIIANIRKKIGKWDPILWSFITSGEMRNIIEYLVGLKSEDKYFVPSLPDALTTFELCRPDKVKCVILTSLKSNVVDLTEKWKLPMSPSNETLKMVLETIARENVNPYNWSKLEGVLQIGTSLTSTLNGQHHHDIWKPWVGYIINKINEQYKDIPWILIGNGTHSYREMIKSKNIGVIQTWPTIWHNNTWTWCNGILEIQGQKPVKWVDKYQKKGTITLKEKKERQFDRYYKKYPDKEPEWRKIKMANKPKEED